MVSIKPALVPPVPPLACAWQYARDHSEFEPKLLVGPSIQLMQHATVNH